MTDPFATRRLSIARLHAKEAAEELDSVIASSIPGSDIHKQATAALLTVGALQNLIEKEHHDL